MQVGMLFFIEKLLQYIVGCFYELKWLYVTCLVGIDQNISKTQWCSLVFFTEKHGTVHSNTAVCLSQLSLCLGPDRLDYDLSQCKLK